jgi:hypothetical protein
MWILFMISGGPGVTTLLCSFSNRSWSNMFFHHYLNERSTLNCFYWALYYISFYTEHPYRHTEANTQFAGHQQRFTCYRTAGELTQKENKPSFVSFYISRNKLNILNTAGIKHGTPIPNYRVPYYFGRI